MTSSMAMNFLVLPPIAAQAAEVVGVAPLSAIQQTAALMALMSVSREVGWASHLFEIANYAILEDNWAKRGFAKLINSGQGRHWSRLCPSYGEAVRAMHAGDIATLARIQGVMPIDYAVLGDPLLSFRRPTGLHELTGIAQFIPLDRLQSYLDSAVTNVGKRVVASGMMVFDTAMPAVYSLWDSWIRRLDHHGDMGERADNTVGQLVQEFREARERSGIGVDETVAIDDPRLKRAIEHLKIRFVSTDNLADGLDAVLMAENQKMFLADPKLLERYEKAMRFVDFGAFSPACANMYFEELPEEVKLALAIYSIHDEALKQKELKFAGADRFAPENARAIAAWELPRLKAVVEDMAVAGERARAMWEQVLLGAGHARTNGVIDEIKVGDNAVVGYLYNGAAMKNYGYFAAQLAFARAHPDAVFYTKVIEFPAAGVVREDPANSESRIVASSRILIAALPYGQTFPNGETMRDEILAALKKAHEDKARELGVQAIPDAAKWAVRDDVIVTVGGTFLTPADMKAVIEGKLAHLFARHS